MATNAAPPTTDGIDEAPQPPRLGPRIRMRALKPAELPPHPDLAPHQQSEIDPILSKFIIAVIEEGHDFITSYLPYHFTVKDSNKSAPPSTAPVELLAHDVSQTALPRGHPPEVWFARTSIHENAAKAGTASWDEFDHGLRVDHSQHEKDYTPGVLDAHQVLSYDEQLRSTDRRINEWDDIHTNIMEMKHSIPFPLNNRVFPVLVITAKHENGKEFIVVQVPVDLKGVGKAKYEEKGGTTTGMYCSVERGEVVEGGAKVKWQMATASDAKGILPMAVQKLGVPGAVVKDVGWFIDWSGKQRARSEV